MVTVTAPGSEVLPWGACAVDHEGDPCSGRLGCVVESAAAERWNESAARRWSMMYQAVRDQLRPRGTVILAYVWEPQRRGVGHLHVVVPVEWLGPVVAALKDLAADYGFGFVDDNRRSRRIKPGAMAGQAGAYIGSYLGKGGKVEAVVDAMRAGVIPRRAFYVSSRLSRGYWTMRFLRLRRRAWAVLHLGAPVPTWCPIDLWVRACEAAGWGASSGLDPPPSGHLSDLRGLP